MSLFQFHPDKATISYVDKPATDVCSAHTVCTIESICDVVNIFLPYGARLEAK